MRALSAYLVSVFVAAALSPAHAVTGSAPSVDVYMVTIDTLRADHVHCYGDEHIQTPALDSLAGAGIRFTQAFTPSPITNTAHTSILTGLLPSVHGVTDFGVPLGKTYPTWAELLKQNGYKTAAFIGSVVLDSRTLAPGLDRGFDYYDNFPPDAPITEHWGRVERRGAAVVHRAELWMDAHPQKSRFVWVHLYDPHDPYQPPLPYSQIYKDHLYDGEIAYADSALGQLIRYLKHEHQYDNALIIVVGDHGEGLGEHGEQTHGIFLYDSTTHVPLIVKLPASPKAGAAMEANGTKVVTAQVQTTDILATVLDVLGISAPPVLRGHSLASYFSAMKEKDRVVFGETDYPLRFGWAPLRTVRSGGYKFIEAPRPELYDLEKDPAELENEYKPWNTTVLQLRSEIASSAMRAARTTRSSGAAASTTLNELRALGYLGPGDEQSSTNAPELSSLPDAKDRIDEQNLLHSAMMLADQGHPADARLLLQKVLDQNADSSAALRQMGELELAAGEYRKSAEHLELFRKTHPEDATAAIEQGQALGELGDLKGARKAFESAVVQMPGVLGARLSLAQIELKEGDRKAAEEEFEAALLLNPKNKDALLGLAGEYGAEGRWKSLVELLEPPAHDRGASREALELLMQGYEKTGRSVDANKMRSRIKALKRQCQRQDLHPGRS